jgi:hypothetical protein
LQKSSSSFIDGGSNPGPENNVMSTEAPDDLPEDKIDQEDKSWYKISILPGYSHHYLANSFTLSWI